MTLCHIAKLPIVEEALRAKIIQQDNIIRKYNELEFKEKELLYNLLQPDIENNNNYVFFMDLKKCNKKIMSKNKCTKEVFDQKPTVSDNWKKFDVQKQETLRNLLVNLYEIRNDITFELIKNNNGLLENIQLKKME